MSRIIQSKRIGRFMIPPLLLESPGGRRIMDHCLVIRCEYLAAWGEFEYHAISGFFREIDFGEVIPIYTWELGQGLGSLQAKEQK
jgi:hypothetical protein